MSLHKSALLVSLTAGVFGVLPAVWAQEQPIVEVPTSRNTVLGEVTGSSVNVRSGPAESYYPTMRLDKGQKVTVVGHKFDWLKIVPPEGSFSYIAKLYVDRDGAGNTGTVNSNDVLVRAGSSISQNITPSKANPQTKLSKGDKVQIIGETEDYFKIVPPEGAYLYITKQFVAIADQGMEVAAVDSPAQSDAPADTAVAGDTDVAVQPSDEAQPEQAQIAPQANGAGATAPAASAEDGVSLDLEAEFRKLERLFEQSKGQDLEQQPLEELLKGYTELQKNQDQLSATTRRMVDFRLRYLEVVYEQQKELLQAKQEAADFAARQLEAEKQTRELEQRIKEQGIAVYTAVGELRTSSVQKDGSPLLRLVDPADGRTLVYIRTADAGQRALVGKFVGVRGNVTTDAQLSIDLIEPSEMAEVNASRVLKGVSAKIYPPSLITRNAQQ